MKNTMTRLLTFSLTLMTVIALNNSDSSAQGPRGRRAVSGSAANGGVSVSSPAPTGTYNGTTGSSAGTASGAGPRGRVRGATATDSTTGGSVAMTVSRFLTSDELNQFLTAQQAGGGQMVKAISNQSYGTVKIGGQTFTINLAASAKVGAGYTICLVSARPFATGTTSGGRAATGGTVGYIKLTVDANGNGTGAMYSSTQVVLTNDGLIEARGGASTATQLTGVTGPKA